ncbi:unnamed protein product, partial [Polarella glacialis]
VQVALGTVTFPLWLGVGITSCCLLPWLLLADAVLQRLYVPRADRVEALAEGTLQMARLWYVAGRLALRRARRVCRSTVQRTLAGRTPLEAASEWLRTLYSDPATAFRAAGGAVAAVSQQGLRTAGSIWSQLPAASEVTRTAKAFLAPS